MRNDKAQRGAMIPIPSLWIIIIVFSISNNAGDSTPVSPTQSTSFEISPSIIYSSDPKIVDITVPLGLSRTEDLITWATYAIRLMASRINVTLNRMINDSHPSEHPIFNAEIGPKKATKEMPKSAVKESSNADSRAFNIYANPPNYNHPFAGILIETPQQLNPFTKYSPNVIYEQTGSGVFPRHPVYYPFYRGNEQPFLKKSVKNASAPTTPMTTATTERSDSPEVDDLNRFSKVKSATNLNTVATVVRAPTTTSRPLITVPFEAFITITREGTMLPSSTITQSTSTNPDSYSTINNPSTDYFGTTARDPPDLFPPFFAQNGTRKNAKTMVKVVFESGENAGKKSKVLKKKKKKPPSILGLILKSLIAPRKKSGDNDLDDNTPPIVRIVSERNKTFQSTLKKQKRPKNDTSLNQEIDDVDDYEDEKLDGDNDDNGNDNQLDNADEDEEEEEEEEEVGSLTAILDLLPIVAPILEDVSNPNSTTDLGELIGALVPLIQGVLEGDEDTPPIDIGGTVGPILASLSAGRDGEGSDIAAVVVPLLSLLLPIIGPIIGSLAGPLSRLSSNPPDRGFSLGALVTSIAGPLSEPIEPGGATPFTNLVTQIVATLSKEASKPNSGSNIGSLIGSLLMGVIAGTSAGISGGSSSKMPHQQPYGPVSASTNTGNNYSNYGNNYGNPPVPANSVNPLDLVGQSIKDILKAGVTIVTAIFSASAGLSGASSEEKQEATYGPPTQYRPGRSF